jgi:hypothetical protein
VGAVLVFVVIATIWSIVRRSRARVRVEGEHGVEPSLAEVSPIAYRGAIVALAAVVLLGTIASNTVHAGSSSTDFARYRGYLALRAAIGVVMWVCWVKVVVTATRLQERREVYAASLPRTPPTYP